MNRHPRSSKHVKRTSIMKKKDEAKQWNWPGGDKTNSENGENFKRSLNSYIQLENITSIKWSQVVVKKWAIRWQEITEGLKLQLQRKLHQKAWNVWLKTHSRLYSKKSEFNVHIINVYYKDKFCMDHRKQRRGNSQRNSSRGTSLGVQWLRICLWMQKIWVWSLFGELRSHIPQGN